MSKFVAGTAVERLEYDFSDFDGGTGYIPEPTRAQVKSYFRGAKALMKEVSSLRDVANVENADDLSDEQVAELMDKVDEAEEKSDEYHLRMIGLVAELCGAEKVEVTAEESPEPVRTEYKGGSPTYDELERLPFRVFQAFSQWLILEIQPKKTTPDMKR